MSTFKRIMSFVLAMVMVVGMLPMPHVHAEETEEHEHQVIETVPATTAAPVETTTASTTQPEDTAPVEETELPAETTVPVTEETVPVTEETVQETETTIPATDETVPAETVEDTVTEEAASATTISFGEVVKGGSLSSYSSAKYEFYLSNTSEIELVFNLRKINSNDWDVYINGKTPNVEQLVYVNSTVWDSTYDYQYRYVYLLKPGTYTVVFSTGKWTFQSYSFYVNRYEHICVYSEVKKYAPTCTSEGYTKYTCPDCNNSYKTDYVEKVPHVYVDNICSVCGQQIGVCGETLEYVVDHKGVLTITGSGDMYDYAPGSAPWYSVRERIKTVSLPEGVTSIGNFAFEDFSTSSLAIPSSVISIGSGAFKNCIALTNIILPEKVEVLSDDAFYGCAALESISIPTTVSHIGNSVFANCTNLTYLVISGDAPTFGNDVFANITATIHYDKSASGWGNVVENSYGGSITWDDTTHKYIEIVRIQEPTCTDIGYSTCTCVCGAVITEPIKVFHETETICPICEHAGTCGVDARWILDENGVLTISGTGKMTDFVYYSSTKTPSTPWYNLRNSVKTIVIEKGITNIGAYAFYYCANATSVSIPNTVTQLGTYSIGYCSSLTEVLLPESVTSIGYAALCWATALTNVTVPSRVNTLGDYVFYRCEKLQSISLPDGIKSIPQYAFAYCGELAKVTIPESVTAIYQYAFHNCTKLKEVYVPYGVKSIGYSFAGCDRNLVFTYPGTMREWAEIGEDKVTYCRDGIVSYSGDCGINAKWILESNGALTIYGSGSMTNFTVYGSADYGSCWHGKTVKTVEIESGITHIGNLAFDGMTKITSVIVPKTVTSVGDYAFRDCTGLKRITFLGSKPRFGTDIIDNIRTNIYYSIYDSSWDPYVDKATFGGAVGWRGIEECEHKSVVDPAVSPTCIAYGKTEGSHCDTCGNVIVKQQLIDPLGHDVIVDKGYPSTCINTGISDGKHCSVCGVIFVKQYKTAALGHTPSTATNCTVSQTCTVCKAELAPAKGHTEAIDKAVAPTCTATGLTEGKHCSVCNVVLVAQQTVPANGHTPGAAATCTTNQICTVCKVELNPAKGHTEVVDKAVAPTCTETGLTEGKHCSVCKAVLVAQQTVPAKGHTPGAAATCTNNQVCTVCKIELKAALGHTKGTAVKEKEVAPTCTTDGSYDSVVYCIVCKAELSRETVKVSALGHKYNSVVTAPTCTEEGYTTYTCTVCKHSYVGDKVNALGHKPGAAATCTTNQTCTVCKVELKAALGHDLIRDKEVPPTCIEPGTQAGAHCSRCDYTEGSSVIPALGHKPGTAVKEKEVAPNCTADGSYDSVVYCSVCKAELSREKKTVPALGHTPGTVATCTTNQICTVCKAELAPAKGHTEVTIKAVAPTCTETGLTEGKQCSVCKVVLVKQEVVKALGHKPGAAATCTTNQICTICKVELKAALGHDLSRDKEVPPTCTEPGHQAGAHCSRCDYTEGSSVIPALGHKPGTAVKEKEVAPNCTEAGSYDSVVYCTVCKEELSREKKTVPAKGHTPGAAATCTTNQICTVCKAELAPAKGHTEVTIKAVAPTCTETGLTEGKQCSVCKVTLVKQDEVPALGHKPGAAATCTTNQTCTVCKVELKAALGHDLIRDNEVPPTCTEPGTQAGAHCSRCDYTEGSSVIPALGHKYSSVVTAPTCTEGGYTTYTCTVCKHSYVGDKVNALGHNPGAAVKEKEIPASCGTDGSYESVVYCERCKIELSREKIIVKATGKHVYATETQRVEPTCTVDGYVIMACGCGATEKTVLPATGHTEVIDAAVASTCTETGLTEGKHCSVCKMVLVKQEVVAALGHNEVIDAAVAPTCTATGLTEGKHCDRCGITLLAQEEIPALGHEYDLGSCIRCGQSDPHGGVLNGTIGWHVDEESGKLIITGTGSASIGGALPWADFADKITSIEIGADVTDVDSSIFDGLTGLTEITVHEDNTNYTSKDGVLFSKDMTVLVKHPGGVAEYTVPETVTTIGSKAFSGCDELKKILFTGSMPQFGSDCFLGVTAEAFYPYDNDTWTEAGMQNYGGSITWTEQGRVIASGKCGDKVFWELEVTGTLRVFGDGKMDRQPVDPFRAWDPYRSQIIRVVVENGVTNVAAQAFTMCSSIRSVTLADSVTEIGEDSFRDCTDLEKVDLPESIKTIDSRAFEDCLSLEQINLPDNIVSIGSRAFYNCDGLREINIPSNIGVIERTTFFDCDSFVKVTIPAMVTSIKEDAFSVCDSLNEIVFEGSAPKMVDGYYGSFWGVTATAYYPADDSTWTPAVKKNYGGKLTWVPYDLDYGQEEVSHITASTTEIQAGEEIILSAILNPGVQTDTEIIWNIEDGSSAATLKTNGAVAALTAGNVTDKATVTVTAKVADGVETARITITILPKPALEPADYNLFSGKSLTLKPINPDTGKAYTAKQLSWSMDSRYDAFATLKNGKLTAKAVLAKTRIEVEAIRNDTGETAASYIVDIFPAVTQLEISCDGEVVNGKTIPVDYTRNTLVLTADAYPLDTLESIQWTISDKKREYAESYIISRNTVTVVNPTGKAGTVTVKATVDAGTKKNVTVKLQFAGYAKEVRIAQPTATTIEGGDSLQMYAAIIGGASKPGITWSIPNKADQAAASISAKGLLKAKKVKNPQTITVIATSKDGNSYDSVEITIIPYGYYTRYIMSNGRGVTGMTEVMNVGDTSQLKAYSQAYGEEKITWKSSKPSVATVTSDGLITAVGPGTTKITAEKYGDKSVFVNIKVTTLVSDMTLTTKDGKNLITENGETIVQVASSKGVNLAATVYPTGANKAVTWEITEGGAYAKISSSGKITANKDLTSVKYVTVKATAKDGSGYSETIRVRIRPLATGVQIYSQQGGRTTFSVRTPENWWVRSNTTLTVDMDNTRSMQLLSHVYPYYGENDAKNAIQGVTWKSSSTKIAAIDDDGTVTFLNTGTITITATANDGSGKKVTFKLKIV